VAPAGGTAALKPPKPPACDGGAEPNDGAVLAPNDGGATACPPKPPDAAPKLGGAAPNEGAGGGAVAEPKVVGGPRNGFAAGAGADPKLETGAVGAAAPNPPKPTGAGDIADEEKAVVVAGADPDEPKVSGAAGADGAVKLKAPGAGTGAGNALEPNPP
jgi:hypothetical protein